MKSIFDFVVAIILLTCIITLIVLVSRKQSNVRDAIIDIVLIIGLLTVTIFAMVSILDICGVYISIGER